MCGLIRRDQQARESLRRALIDGERSGVSHRTASDAARQGTATVVGMSANRISQGTPQAS